MRMVKTEWPSPVLFFLAQFIMPCGGPALGLQILGRLLFLGIYVQYLAANFSIREYRIK